MAQVVGSVETGLAEAARSGDAQALDALAAECLPLVYAIVRRSLGAGSDVDDVVQDVMLNVVRGLGSLRDPDRLRAWLAAVTVNQIRAHLRSGRAEFAVAADRYEPFEAADPASEFVGHTLLQLDLSQQRRETARAADWLDPEHRDLLGLWWLETSGHLSRADLVAALRLDPHHVTVRIGRMKEQLDGCRQLLRALDAGCVELMELASDWRGETSSVWRKRFIRHIRVCRRCLAAADGLIAPERLLAGLALPALPLAYFGPGRVGAGSGGAASGASGASGTSGVPGASSTSSDIIRTHDHSPQAHSTPHRQARHRAGSHGGSGGVRGTSRAGVKTLLAKPLVLAAATLSVLGVAAAVVLITRPVTTTSIPQSASTGQAVTAASALASAGSVVIPSAPASQSAAPASPSPSLSRAPRHSAPPTAPATHAAAPATSASSGSGGAQSPAEQVLAVINRARASAGLAPYTMSANLIKSATAHNNLMAGGCGLSHQCPGEAAIGDRETAAGVHWTACGENIGEGGPEPHTDAGMAAMAVNLTNSMLAEKPPNDGHRRNILSSSFTEVGIAVTIDSSGTVWLTQDFAN